MYVTDGMFTNGAASVLKSILRFDMKNMQKGLRNSVFSTYSFAHLLCVHMI